MGFESSPGFSSTLQSWQPFYALAGGASATLLGLLFVSISINVRAVEQSQHGNLRWVASQTFNNLFYILLLSLLMIAPSRSANMTSSFLASVGVSGVIVGIFMVIKAHKSGTLKRDRNHIRRIVLPIVAHLITIFTANAISNGDFNALFWPIGAVVLLTMGGIRGSWDLLFLLGTASTDTTTPSQDEVVTEVSAV